MKKKFFLIFLFISCVIHADTYDGIFVWVNNTSTCYKLESAPKVTYGKGCAVVIVDGKEVLNLPLTGKQHLTITYGTYESSEPTVIPGISTETKVHKEGKVIRGGKIIIVKGNKQYTTDGKILKNDQ